MKTKTKMKIPIISEWFERRRRLSALGKDLQELQKAHNEQRGWVWAIQESVRKYRTAHGDLCIGVGDLHRKLEDLRHIMTQFSTDEATRQATTLMGNTVLEIANTKHNHICDKLKLQEDEVGRIRASHGKTLWKNKKGVGELFKRVKAIEKRLDTHAAVDHDIAHLMHDMKARMETYEACQHQAICETRQVAARLNALNAPMVVKQSEKGA